MVTDDQAYVRELSTVLVHASKGGLGGPVCGVALQREFHRCCLRLVLGNLLGIRRQSASKPMYNSCLQRHCRQQKGVC